MSEFKGTKGKWSIPEHRDNIVNDEFGNHIATVWIAGIGNDNQIYNTKLIAAAPELLEALMASKAVFEALGIYANHRIAGEQYDKVVQAIKKATE